MGNILKNSNKRKFKHEHNKGKLIGRGSFGTVYEARLRNDPSKLFAAKIIRTEHLSKKELQKMSKDEISSMQQLEHQNIIRLFEVFRERKQLVLILELCTGGTLFERLTKIKCYSEKDAVDIVLQLAKAVEHMHSRGVVHRDLKPENILFETNDPQSPIKVTDFGLSKFLIGKSKMYSSCGTPNFVAPEIVLKKPYNEKVDIWSIGIILYVILSGHLPFYSRDLQTLLVRIAMCKFHFRPSAFKNVSPFGKVIIRKLLCSNPDQRPSASELVVLLEQYKKQAHRAQLSKAQENLRKLNLVKKLRRGLTMFVGIHAIYELGIGKKKLKTLCGQTHLVDASVCTPDENEVPYARLQTPPKEAGCMHLSDSLESPKTMPVSPGVIFRAGPQVGL